MPYFDERTLLASIARRRHRLEAPEKPSMIDAKDESSPMSATDEIRSAFGQVMAAILNAVGDCPAREKAVCEGPREGVGRSSGQHCRRKATRHG